MTRNKTEIEDIQAKIKQTQRELRESQLHIKTCEATLVGLSERLEGLVLSDSSSEASSTESVTELKIGDHVIPTTEPHKGRT